MTKKLEILKDVFYVGYVDWEVRNFHGYSTHKGSSYNAYIVKNGNKTILIDTVKRPYFNYYLQNIRLVCDPKEIDYLILNHIEPDHSGSFPLILPHIPNAEIIASIKGVEILEQHYHEEVDAAIQQLKEIVEKHWDDNKHNEYYKQELIKIWQKNEYGLQDDYKDNGGFKTYLTYHGFSN